MTGFCSLGFVVHRYFAFSGTGASGIPTPNWQGTGATYRADDFSISQGTDIRPREFHTGCTAYSTVWHATVAKTATQDAFYAATLTGATVYVYALTPDDPPQSEPTLIGTCESIESYTVSYNITSSSYYDVSGILSIIPGAFGVAALHLGTTVLHYDWIQSETLNQGVPYFLFLHTTEGLSGNIALERNSCFAIYEDGTWSNEPPEDWLLDHLLVENAPTAYDILPVDDPKKDTSKPTTFYWNIAPVGARGPCAFSQVLAMDNSFWHLGRRDLTVPYHHEADWFLVHPSK